MFAAVVPLLATAYMLPDASTGTPLLRRSVSPLLSEAPVLIPPSVPTFGLSEREQIRFRHMILAEEPLPHEVFGLQILFGAIGTQIAGFVGCLMGTFQIAPCVSWLPGVVGDGLRTVGWQAFAVARSGARTSVTAWRASGMAVALAATIAAIRRFDEHMHVSAAVGHAGLSMLKLLWRMVTAFAGGLAMAGGVAARQVGVGGGAGDAPPPATGDAPPRAAD